MEPRWRELPLLKPDREDRSALFREYSAKTQGGYTGYRSCWEDTMGL